MKHLTFRQKKLKPSDKILEIADEVRENNINNQYSYPNTKKDRIFDLIIAIIQYLDENETKN